MRTDTTTESPLLHRSLSMSINLKMLLMGECRWVFAAASPGGWGLCVHRRHRTRDGV
jgi:hypothetical protein